MNVKLTSAASLILVFVCLAGRYVLSYWLGYYEKSYSPLGYQDLLAMFEFILFTYILIIWIISLFWKKYRLWTSGTMIALLLFIGLDWIMPPPDQTVVYGLRDRLVHDNSLDDLRHFAQDFNQLPRSSNDHLGAQTNTKQYMREDLAKTSLKEKYPFLSWVKGPGFDGPSYVHEEDGIIDVRWGGALSGHWGFSIAVNGGKLDLPSEPGTKALHLSDDIIVVSEPD